MEFLKSKQQVVNDKLASVHESVFKQGDVYKVRTTIDVPKSLINAFVSKAKKEHNIDARENWSDTELAEMFISYITANFVNIDTLPVTQIIGEPSKADGELKTDVQPTEQPITDEPAQPLQPEVQPVAAQPGEPTAEIQTEI
jgi:hypothetical protein